MNIEQPRRGVTPKDFFLWVAVMAALYVSVISFITLIFQYIDYLFPDATQYFYGDPYSGAIRFALASLIVVLPLYLILTRLLNQGMRRDPLRKELWVRKWLIFLTLFVGGITLVVDLVWLINDFLAGELTTRFLLKVVTVFVVVGSAFLYYLADLRGRWALRERQALTLGGVAVFVVLASVVAGFFIIGTPAQARLYRFDEQKVMDLQSIQWQVVNYYQQKGRAPAASKDLEDPISGFVLPRDPEDGSEYGYRVTKPPYTFELCAEFNTPSRGAAAGGKGEVPMPVDVRLGGIEGANWQHGEGRVCFERTIDPERYPLIKR